MSTVSAGRLSKGEGIPEAQMSENVPSPTIAKPAYRGLKR